MWLPRRRLMETLIRLCWISHAFGGGGPASGENRWRKGSRCSPIEAVTHGEEANRDHSASSNHMTISDKRFPLEKLCQGCRE